MPGPRFGEISTSNNGSPPVADLHTESTEVGRCGPEGRTSGQASNCTQKDKTKGGAHVSILVRTHTFR
jgi:hypothetical protein